MNWYKKARLADVNYDAEGVNPLNIACQYCDRLATHPTDVSATSETRTWKTIDELDPEEKMEFQAAIRNNKLVLSHGICDNCWGVLETEGWGLDPKIIKEKSLEMA